ncbi:hypothetical protein COJ52_28300 [Bacillus cereus]|nr:hypothetical protein COJ52_28300 [Bacillus cereus]
MFVEHPEVNSNIEKNAKLWRYMDFAKLVSLLSTQKLYFCRTDKFKDVFEGKLFGFQVEDMRKNLERIIGEHVIYGSDERIKIDPIVIEQAEELTQQVYHLSEYDREKTFVNCWHLNEYESAAMWDLYLKSNEGIAIQTSFDRLKRSLQNCKEDIFIGRVKYIDHTKESNFGHGLSPFFTKRNSFSHEKEVRLLYSAVLDNNANMYPDENILGKNFHVDLEDLIERVYVSPDAPSWFVDVVKVILEKFNIDAEVIHSDLYELK